MNPRASKLSKALIDLSQVADTVLRLSNAGVAAMRGKTLSNAERCLLERIDGFRSIEQVLAISGDLIGVHAALGKLLALSLVVAEGEPDTTPVEAPAAKRPAPPPVPARPAPPAAAAPPSSAALRKPPAVAAAIAKSPPAVAKSPPAIATAPKPAPAKPVPAKPTPTAAPPAKPVVAAKPPAAPANAPTNAAAPKAALTELAQAKALLRIEAGQLFGNKAPKVIEKVDACKSVEEIYDIIVKVQGLLAKTGKGDPDVFLDRLTNGLQRIRAAQKSAAAARRS